MSHIFNPENRHKLDNPERRAELPPEQVLKLLDIEEGQTVLDIGAGTGFFAVPALEFTGESGKVIAADISTVMLDEIRKKVPDRQNMHYRLIQPDNPECEPQSADRIIMAFVLHEVKDAKEYLNSIRPALKSGGRILIIEWKKEPMAKGPPLEHRFSADETAAMLNLAGFTVHRTVMLNQSHYAVIAG